MRATWKQAAVQDVEAAHGAAMMRLKQLKSDAHAAKRAALIELKKVEMLSGKYLDEALAAEELANELRERADELEEQLQEGAADPDAMEKVESIRELKTEGRGAGQGRGRWWPWWVRAMIIEQLIAGTPPTAIPSNMALKEQITTYITLIRNM